MASPEFQDAFQKNTGTDLGTFLNNADSPKAALMAASSGGMDPSQAGDLSSALDAAQEQLPQEFSSMGMTGERALASDSSTTGYSKGGSTQKAGAEINSDSEISKLMTLMISKSTPQAGEKKLTNPGLTTVIFANKTQSPVAIAENKQLNLFDRVSYRYIFVEKKIFNF